MGSKREQSSVELLLWPAAIAVGVIAIISILYKVDDWREQRLSEQAEAVEAARQPLRAREAALAPVGIPPHPENTLRALVALNAIGADLNDSVEVIGDRAPVLVQGHGLSPERKTEIGRALKGVPGVALELDLPAAEAAAPESATAGSVDPVFRKQLEDRMGGPGAFRENVARASDASTSLVAQARAFHLVTALFTPETQNHLSIPDRRLLQTLQQRHLARIRSLAGEIRGDLEAILPVPPGNLRLAAGSRVPLQSARELDSLLRMLFNGRITASTADESLRRLLVELDALEQAVHLPRS